MTDKEFLQRTIIALAGNTHYMEHTNPDGGYSYHERLAVARLFDDAYKLMQYYRRTVDEMPDGHINFGFDDSDAVYELQRLNDNLEGTTVTLTGDIDENIGND